MAARQKPPLLPELTPIRTHSTVTRMKKAGSRIGWFLSTTVGAGAFLTFSVPALSGFGFLPTPALGEVEAVGVGESEAIPDLLAALPVELVFAGDPLPWAAEGLSERASFQLRVRDVVIPFSLLAVTALPGEVVELEVQEIMGEGDLASFRLREGESEVAPIAAGRWNWTAPLEPGAYPIRIESPMDGSAIHLNVIVLHPFESIRNGSLNGFRIGEYRLGAGRTTPPSGFIRGDSDMLDLRVAPGFTLRQFLCKQGGAPPYLALSEPLLLKLETILEAVRDAGIEAPTLHIMSGFRTPYYNRAIGNTTDLSRHLWGDAADIFIDTDGNGRMDDLNGDGRSDDADARLLVRIVEEVEARGEPQVRAGGLSIYRSNAVRGAFVHVDARGAPARW